MAANIYDWSVVAANNSNSDADLTWAEGQAPSTVNNSARVVMQRAKQFLVDIGGSLSAGGTANGLTVTASSPFTAYADGMIISFRATASNSGAATLSVNGIGAKAIRKMGRTADIALAGGEITNTGIYIVQYSAALNGAAGAWLLVGANSLDTLTLQGAAIASAATTDIGAATGRYVHVTGSVAITAFGTVAAGVEREVVFDAAPLITYNATSLILPGAINIQAAAGDVGVFVSEGSGNWRMISYQTAAIGVRKSPTQQVFSTPGAATWTKPAGCIRAEFEGCGAGGGSGGVNGTGAPTGVTAGGGSGFSGTTGILDVSAVASATLAIGAGGTAGTHLANGGNGGNTTAIVGATTYTWGGGVGSDFRNVGTGVYSMEGGVGGVGTNVTGFSQQGTSGVGSTTDNNVTAGAGGSSLFGTGGVSRHSITAAAAGGGLQGTGFGAGASGAFNNGVNSDQNGAAGMGGYLRVTEYY